MARSHLQEKLIQLSKKNLKRRKYRQILVLASLIVSLSTFYALMAPAITLTCALDEHIHIQECYTLVCDEAENHEHSSECYGDLKCVFEEHLHSEACYEERSIALFATRATRVDLSPHITEATYDNVKYNENLGVYETSFHLKFHDLSKQEILNANYQFVFDFPEGVYIPDELLNIEHVAYDGSQPSFTFKFVKSGTSASGKPLYHVEIDFYPEYVANVYTLIDNEINFKGQLDPSLKDSEGDFNVTFTPDVTIEIGKEDITYDGDSTENYDMNVSKKGNFDISNNKLTYTMVVETQKGTPSPIVLKDVLASATGINIGSPSIVSVVKQSSSGNQSYVSGGNYTFSANGTSFDLTLKQGLNDNEKYIIVYEYPLSNVVDGTNVNVNNKVETQAKDPTTNEQIQDSTNVNVNVKKDVLQKTGQYDANTGMIHWTVVVNSDHMNIAGYTLKDSMFASAQNLIVTSDGSNTGYTIDKNGSTITGITFNAVSGGTNTQQYTITYSTKVNANNLGWNESTITNNATFDKWGQDQSKESTEIKVSGGNVVKTKGTVTTQNGIQTIPFTSQLTIPNGGIPSGTVIQDTLTGSNHYMTKQQMTDLYQSIQSASWKNKVGSFQVTTDGNTWVDYSSATGDRFVGFRMTTTQTLYPYDNVKLSYNTTIDGTENYGKHSFSNTIKVGDKQSQVTWQDSFTNVSKTDGNDRADDSSVTSKDGTVTWKIKVSLSEKIDELEIIDTLPEGLTLIELKYGHPYNLLATKINSDGSISPLDASGAWWSNNLDISGSTYHGNKITLKAKVANASDTHPRAFEADSEFYVIVKAQIDEAEGMEIGDIATFEGLSNHVDVIINQQTYSDDHNQDVTVKIPDPDAPDEPDQPDAPKDVLTKGGTWNNDARLLEYSIIINPEEKDLSGDDRVTLIDDLLYNKDTSVDLKIMLAQESVKLYYAQIDSEGKISKGEQVPNSEWKWEYIQNSGKNWSNLSNTIEAIIPDETALILEYAYKVYLDESKINGSYHPYIQNNATLKGTDTSTDQNGINANWKEITTSGSSAANKTFLLYKVDSRNYGVTLDGAEFTLYKYNGSEYVSTGQIFTTHDGKINIQWQSKDTDYQFEYNTAYYIIETKPPAGYKLSDDITQYYFCFSSNSSSIDLIPDAFSGTDLSISTQIIYHENEKPVVEVKVDKQWIDEEGNPLDGELPSIEVELWRYGIPDDVWKAHIDKEPSVELNMQVKATSWGGIWWDETLSIKQNSTITITLVNQYGAHGSSNIPELYYNDQLITFTKENPSGTVYEWTGSFIVSEGGTFSGCLNWWSESDWTRDYTVEMAFPSIPEDVLLQYKETVAYDTVFLKDSNGWFYHWDDLGQIGIDDKGNLIHYVYEVDEGFISGYTPTLSSEFDKITGNYHYHLVNQKNKQELYILPDTGGITDLWYITSGLALMILAGSLSYKKRITERRWHPPDS